MDRASDVYKAHTRRGSRFAGGLQPRLSRGMANDSGQFPYGYFREQHEPMERRPLHGLHSVPGVLLSNRSIDAASPALTDIAPTIFAQFGIPQPGGMMGHSVFSSNR